jgi:hypothetical protein
MDFIILERSGKSLSNFFLKKDMVYELKSNIIFKE